MKFLAVLNHEHLDNGMFLKSFAKSLAQKKERGIIIHGDSEYTERIIQTGVMREDAEIRSIKDLNHRLVALFADEGISTIALNGYQKSTVKLVDGMVQINDKNFKALPSEPMILLSNLANDETSKSPVPVSLPALAKKLKLHFDIPHITVFSKNEMSDITKNDFPLKITPSKTTPTFKENHLPNVFFDYTEEIVINTPSKF